MPNKVTTFTNKSRNNIQLSKTENNQIDKI